jgi:alanyl-tRNA synthetase
VGTVVTGTIDWAPRFLRMQQHSGEHIVSGIINRRYGYHNTGFHMGNESITIDFDGIIPAEDLPSIEAEANSAVWSNIPVKCWYPSEEELPSVGYRTKRQLPWPVRIVEIPGVDLCACCGTHVKSTGEIGFVKLFSCVKFHQGVRIEMACGARALAFLSKVYEQNRQVSQAFSAKLMETGEAARKMNDALAAEKYRAVSLQKQIFAYTAEQYREKGFALHFEEALSPAGVRELAEIISGVCGGTAAVFSGNDGKFDVCIANPGGDVKELGTRMAKQLKGRGGGKPGFFQGSVKATKEQVEAFFRNI